MTFDKEAMLRRAKERGGTASMIVCSVCHDAKNSDIRADNPALLMAFNERFDLLESQRDDLLEALRLCVLHGGGECLGDHPQHLAAARAAIAKAEGK